MRSKPGSPDAKRTSRREFARSIASTLLAAPLAAQLVKAQTPAKPKEPPAPPNPQPGPAPQAPSPLAVAYAEVARQRFGEHLTPEQFEQIKKDLDSNARNADRLRAVKLKNADEPDFIFNSG